MLRRLHISAAVFFALAGAVLLWTIRQPASSHAHAWEQADQLFAAFDTRSGLKDAEVRAIQELYASSIETRVAFLHRALETRGNTARLDTHRHAFAVALSTVSSADTRVLFEREIVPVIKKSNDPLVLREALVFTRIWSIPDALSVQQRRRLAAALTDRYFLARERTMRNDLRIGIELFRGSQEDEEAEPQPFDDPLSLRLDLAQDPEHARGMLAERVRTTEDVRLLAAAAFHLSTLPKDGTLDEFTAIVAKRIAEQEGSYEISLLNGALEGLASHGVNGKLAAELADLLVARIERERDIPELMRVVAALQIVAPFVPENVAPPLVSRLLDRMRPESAATTLRMLAFAIGSLSEGAREDQMDEAAIKLTERLQRERNPTALRDLVAGLLNIRDEVPESYLETASIRVESLIPRWTAPDDLAVLIATRLALGGEAAKIAEMLIERIRGERDPAMLRALGELLSSLPAGSIDSSQLAAIAAIFTIPDAPCAIAARIGEAQRKEAAARHVQNPLCSEISWKELAIILAPEAEDGNADDEIDDFHTLIVEDDDDGESETGVGGFGIYPIDFNRLSREVDPFRLNPATKTAVWQEKRR